MSYDNTKLNLAVDSWIKKNCKKKGFGEAYAGDLLDDFEQFCANTEMMKRSPGRVAFGKVLAERKYEKRKLNGLVYWSGLILKNPPAHSKPRYHDATVLRLERKTVRREEKDRLRQIDWDAAKETEADIKEKLKKFKAENRATTKNRALKAGD